MILYSPLQGRGKLIYFLDGGGGLINVARKTPNTELLGSPKLLNLMLFKIYQIIYAKYTGMAEDD